MNEESSREIMQITKNVYRHFGRLPDGSEDNLSKQIFRRRTLYSITGDIKYIASIIKKSPTLTDCIKRSEKVLLEEIFQQKQFVLAGWGTSAKLCYDTLLKDLPWVCVADINAKNITDCPVEILTRAEAAEKYHDAVYVIPYSVYAPKIEQELRDLKIESIFNMKMLCESQCKQYMDVIPFTDNEVFVDGGCFDLSTVIAFRKASPGCKVYSFEPDKYNYASCKEKAEKLSLTDGITIENSGLWSDTGTLRFNATSDAGSKITESGESQIEVTSLDEYFADKDVLPTFIKMDIEGSEFRALEGAKNIIRKVKPRLAICIYHKPEDILSLPGYILELNDSYNFALRHYSLHETETVLYAW